MTAWATPEELAAIWPDAPSEERLAQLAEASQEALEAYAPALKVVDGTPVVPRRYVEALALQCKDTWGAAQREGDVIGDADFPIRVRFISDTVRGLLRPRNPRPRFGRRTPA